MSAPSSKPLEICIVSAEFIGAAALGATGISYTAMAQALAAAGHRVTCLFLGAKVPSPSEWQRWVEKYKADGLTLIALPQINASELVAPSNLIKSYEAYQWLKRNNRFDFVHFPERQGPGYHTLTAKHHGVAFGSATISVGLHSMEALIRGASPKPVDKLTEVDTEFMERRAVALADAVVRPNQNLIDWIEGRGRPGSGPPNTATPCDDAVQAAVQALSIDPGNIVALKVLARIHLNAGLPEAAEEVCLLILKEDETDFEALQMLEEITASSSPCTQETRHDEAAGNLETGFAPKLAFS